MKRIIISHLHQWYVSNNRKPLILRGARQTGKTYSVRDFCAQYNITLIELNFERNPEYADAFTSNNPQTIIQQLELLLNIDIPLQQTLLFLDEIQAKPFVLSKLRWFYEELPEIAVISAGSLLEFALDDFQNSMPVGRVSYMYLHPMSFTEFLWAMNEERLADHLADINSFESISDALHARYLELFRQYSVIGGMPAVVKLWSETNSINNCITLQKDIITSYYDDFNKYRNNVSVDLLQKSFRSIVHQMGNGFNYSIVDRDFKQPVIKKAVEMLEKAGICKRVFHCSANGIPLDAEANYRIFKNFFLDCGLAMNILGLCPLSISDLQNISFSNKGAIAEQMVQQLLFSTHWNDNDTMHFWQQTGAGNGEIDFVLQDGARVLPVEVKSGTSGSMKSLHSFMESKQLHLAIRFDLNKPSRQEIKVKTNQGKPVSYTLISLPVYMTEFYQSYCK